MSRLRMMMTLAGLAAAGGFGLISCSGSSGVQGGPDGSTATPEGSTLTDQTSPVDGTTPTDGSIDSPSDAPRPDGGSVGSMHMIAYNGFIAVLSSIRICFVSPYANVTIAMDPQPPQGIAPGLLSKIQVPDSIAGKSVRVFTYYTTSLTAFGLSGDSCPELVAKSALATDKDAGPSQVLLQTLDFDISPPMPSPTFSTSSSYLLTMIGCPASSKPLSIGDSNSCGPVQKGVNKDLGHYSMFAFKLDTSAPPAGSANVQGLDAVGLNNYYIRKEDSPFAYELGIVYADAGKSKDAGTLLTGPAGGAFSSWVGMEHRELQTGPLPPPTAVPSLTNASELFYITSTYDPFFDGGFKYAGYQQLFKISDVLTDSNLTKSDLSGASFTFVLMGDSDVPPTGDDGGANPVYRNIRVIRNDTL